MHIINESSLSHPFQGNSGPSEALAEASWAAVSNDIQGTPGIGGDNLNTVVAALQKNPSDTNAAAQFMALLNAITGENSMGGGDLGNAYSYAAYQQAKGSSDPGYKGVINLKTTVDSLEEQLSQKVPLSDLLNLAEQIGLTFNSIVFPPENS